MSEALHLIMVASCQAEGSKCINGIQPSPPPAPSPTLPPPLIYTCTDRWSCHCSGTKADDAVLNRLDKRRNLGVLSQHQNLSHSYRSVLMLFSFTMVHLAFIFGCIYSVSAAFTLSLHLFFFSCFLQNVLIWTNSVMRKWNSLRRIRTHAPRLLV